MNKSLLILLCAAVFGSAEAAALLVREALAMFESGAMDHRRGAADRLRGRSGEVSRYQIMPAVWRQYSRSIRYDDPAVAWSVAERILRDRIAWFRKTTGREANALEVYLLWNKPGHFHAAQFDPGRVKTLFRKRAQRFANLFEALAAAVPESRGNPFRFGEPAGLSTGKTISSSPYLAQGL